MARQGRGYGDGTHQVRGQEEQGAKAVECCSCSLRAPELHACCAGGGTAGLVLGLIVKTACSSDFSCTQTIGKKGPKVVKPAKVVGGARKKHRYVSVAPFLLAANF